MRFWGLLRRFVLVGITLAMALTPKAHASSGGITVLPDGSVIIQIVNFIFLIWILNIVVYTPIRNILLKRKEKISDLEAGIQNSLSEAKEQENSWMAGIKNARAKGLEHKDSLIQAAEEDEKKILDRINRKASEDLAQLREKISKDVDDVRAALKKEIDAFVDAISEKILGRNV
jgi:F-type H+-transporting ATPase subunit b